jgi:hypothetical protein
MTIGMRPICVDCVHFRRGGSSKPGVWGLYCDAYPDPPGIPDAILFTQVDHRKPQLGDHGVQFQAIDEEHEKDALLVLATIEEMGQWRAEQRKRIEARDAAATPPTKPGPTTHTSAAHRRHGHVPCRRTIRDTQ